MQRLFLWRNLQVLEFWKTLGEKRNIGPPLKNERHERGVVGPKKLGVLLRNEGKLSWESKNGMKKGRAGFVSGGKPWGELGISLWKGR